MTLVANRIYLIYDVSYHPERLTAIATTLKAANRFAQKRKYRVEVWMREKFEQFYYYEKRIH